MKEKQERINIVYIHPEQCYGTAKQMGAYASIVKYEIDGVEFEELLPNEDFTIVQEINHGYTEIEE